ncbi:MAG TPA: N-acetyltransferase [Ramlibacter sp.]|nr:N-acetyltransferase [Ramlibacter sp.]
MTEGLAPCEKLLDVHHVPEDLRQDSWEVGRLVLGQQYRSGPESLKRCLFLTLVHLIENTNVENLFASCTPLLSRLYRRFGFSVLVKEASRDTEGNTYSLIHGTVPGVLRALAGTPIERELADEILALRESAEVLPC